MDARQERQRPRSSSQPSNGTLSCQAIGAPQDGQRDPGRATDSRRGTRWMTTLANDPAASPSIPATTRRRVGSWTRAYRARSRGSHGRPQTGRGGAAVGGPTAIRSSVYQLVSGNGPAANELGTAQAPPAAGVTRL